MSIDIPWQFLGTVGAVSGVLLAVTVLATPWLVAQLPPDYFQRRHPHPSKVRRNAAQQLRRTLWLIVRNALGVTLMLLGVIMFVTPGPGLVCLVLGLSLTEFPGKHRLLMWLVGQPRVLAALNWLRRRAHRAPFEPPVI